MNLNTANTPANMQTTNSNMPSSPTKADATVHSSSMFKKLLSMAAFFMAFATVMTLLLIYYDNTGNRMKCSMAVIAYLLIIFQH